MKEVYKDNREEREVHRDVREQAHSDREVAGEATTWKVLGPILVAVVMAIGGGALSVIAVGNTRELDQHDHRIDNLEQNRTSSSERLKGIEVQLSYIVEDTTETKQGVKELKEGVDSLTRSLVGPKP